MAERDVFAVERGLAQAAGLAVNDARAGPVRVWRQRGQYGVG